MLKIIKNEEASNEVKTILKNNQESLIICLNPNGDEYDIVVYSKLLDRSMLTVYLKELISSLINANTKSNNTVEDETSTDQEEECQQY
jgi:hypothetical protein